MFLSDEVLADASPAAAAARLAAFTRRTALVRASHSAWDSATASIGRVGPCPGHPRLTRVRCQGPVGQGSASMLILRWEAVDDGGLPFPALDADITLMPYGEHAVLIGLAGVYRTPPGARPAQPAVHMAAAAAIRALLTHIADAVSDLAAVRTGAIRIAPAALESAPTAACGDRPGDDKRPLRLPVPLHRYPADRLLTPAQAARLAHRLTGQICRRIPTTFRAAFAFSSS